MKKNISLLIVLVIMACLLVGCGGDKDTAIPAEAPVVAETAEVTSEVTWESYLNWLADTFGANSPDPDAYRALLFQAQSWEDIDVTIGPWDKLFAEDAFDASTWDEYVAAGGVGTYNEAFEDDALTGSGEPTGEASAEPTA